MQMLGTEKKDLSFKNTCEHEQIVRSTVVPKE